MQRSTFRALASTTLAANLAVIAWGAYVRATGSGAGCGSHWPLCNGEVIPRAPSIQTIIEYSHRLSSGVALLLVIAVLVFAWRTYERGHPVRKAALATMVLMLLEAAIGAGIVLFELVADNASMARGMFMAVHLGNTFLLLAANALTILWADAPRNLAWRPPVGLARWAWASVAGTLLIGISGSVAALGDTLFPAESLLDGLRQDLSASSHILIQLRVLHPVFAIAGAFLLLYFVTKVRDATDSRPARRFATALNFLVLLQLAMGGLNMMLLAPVPMQLLHLLLADLVWLSLIGVIAFALFAPAPTMDRETT